MRELLQLDFFEEETGIKVELARKEEDIESNSPVIKFRMRVMSSKKRKTQHKENEALEFDYNIEKDKTDQVVQEMVCS